MLPSNTKQGTANGFLELLKKTSRKIVAVGASWCAWLRAVDQVEITPEVSHTPDPKLIDEITALLRTGERTPKDS
jgi:hypothetical protein